MAVLLEISRQERRREQRQREIEERDLAVALAASLQLQHGPATAPDAPPRSTDVAGPSAAIADGDSDSEDDENTCSVCLEPAEPNRPMYKLCAKCPYGVHHKCAADWRKRCADGVNNGGRPQAFTCPTCRAPIGSSSS